MFFVILLTLAAVTDGENRAWQSACCGVGKSFPKNWTDPTCWSKSAISQLPTASDKATFQLTSNCLIRVNDTETIIIAELYIQNAGLQMQILGSGASSKNSFTASTYSVASYSSLTMMGLNTIFSGSSSLLGILNLTDCRAIGSGNIAISSTGQLILLRSAPMILEFHVNVINRGLITIQSTSFQTNSILQNWFQMSVDVSSIAEIQGASQPPLVISLWYPLIRMCIPSPWILGEQWSSSNIVCIRTAVTRRCQTGCDRLHSKQRKRPCCSQFECSLGVSCGSLM
jgi:hypothetical protein